MISNIVKSKIEFESKLITSTNPFFIDARNGMLKEQVVKDYLHNIFYLFKQTVTCLDDAHRRALEAGSPELAEFFKEKIKEELGHDQWARSDLLKFGDNIELVQLEKLKPSMIELVNYIRETIEEDPKLYLIYIGLRAGNGNRKA